LTVVPETGGAAAIATSVDNPGQDGQFSPSFLPDGDHFLYTLWSWASPPPDYVGVYVASLSGAEPPRRLLEERTNAVFASGFLLFTRRDALMAQRFDPKTLRLSGDALTVVDAVERSLWDAGMFSVSGAGHLAYRGRAPSFDLGWLDSSGGFESIGGPQQDIQQLRLSPDGQAVVAVAEDQEGRHDIWRVDLSSGRRTRLTFRSSNWFPVWSPDSLQVLFSRYESGYPQLMTIPATGGLPQALLGAPGEDQIARDWSRDGRYILYELSKDYVHGVARTWALSLYDREARRSRVVGPGGDGVLSPDGQWLAYVTTETGIEQVHVRAVSGERRWQISGSQGREPAWHRSGRRIAFRQGPTRIVGTTFSPDAGAATGAGEVLFEHPGLRAFSLTSDFSRALVSLDHSAGRTPLTVVVNWTEGLADSGEGSRD
ncbi:MAG: hypothetical protein OEW19_05780, partial [Acidobacteriota bacterium]|nr:hypothetical protein [Acidobacteriota bacterium]